MVVPNLCALGMSLQHFNHAGVLDVLLGPTTKTLAITTITVLSIYVFQIGWLKGPCLVLVLSDNLGGLIVFM